MEDHKSVKIYDAHGFYMKDKDEVLDMFGKCASLIELDSRIWGQGRNSTYFEWYVLKEGADLYDAVILLERILKWCERFGKEGRRFSAYISEEQDGDQVFRIGCWKEAVITIRYDQLPSRESYDYKEIHHICDEGRIKLLVCEDMNDDSIMIDCFTGEKYCLRLTEGYGSVDDADSFTVIELLCLSQNDSVILFEEKDNPYEKTVIGAELKNDILSVESFTIESDGSYGLKYCVNNEALEKLCRVLSTSKNGLLECIKRRFYDERADMEFGRFCNANGIMCNVYRS